MLLSCGVLKISCQHCWIQDFLKGAPEFFWNFAEIEKWSGGPGSSSIYNYEYASWKHFYLELEFHKYNKYQMWNFINNLHLFLIQTLGCFINYTVRIDFIPKSLHVHMLYGRQIIFFYNPLFHQTYWFMQWRASTRLQPAVSLHQINLVTSLISMSKSMNTHLHNEQFSMHFLHRFAGSNVILSHALVILIVLFWKIYNWGLSRLLFSGQFEKANLIFFFTNSCI